MGYNPWGHKVLELSDCIGTRRCISDSPKGTSLAFVRSWNNFLMQKSN